MYSTTESNSPTVVSPVKDFTVAQELLQSSITQVCDEIEYMAAVNSALYGMPPPSNLDTYLSGD